MILERVFYPQPGFAQARGVVSDNFQWEGRATKLDLALMSVKGIEGQVEGTSHPNANLHPPVELVGNCLQVVRFGGTYELSINIHHFNKKCVLR